MQLADSALRLDFKKGKFSKSEQCNGSALDCRGETREKVGEWRNALTVNYPRTGVWKKRSGDWLERRSSGFICDRGRFRTLEDNTM